MIAYLRQAREGWRSAAKLGEDAYPLDITFGTGPHLRGSWQVRDGEMERELLDAAWVGTRYEGPPRLVEAEALKAIEALSARNPVVAGTVTPEAPDRFARGQTVAVRLPVSGIRNVEHRLHYRHVNQGERWECVPMRADGSSVAAEIPGSYTDSRYHLQYFISSAGSNGSTLTPGFSPGIANQPYAVIRQQ